MQNFDHMILKSHVANKIHYTSIIRVPIVTKLDRMITYLDELLPIKSHDPLITWPCEIGDSVARGGSARKLLSCQRLLVFI